MNSPRLRDVWSVVRVGVVVGTVAGSADGLGTLSRNVYAPQFALFCVAAPIVSTTLFLSLIALTFGFLTSTRKRSDTVRTGCVAGWLVGAVAVLWALLYWTGLVARARQAGGGGLIFGVALLPLLAFGVSAGIVTRAALAHLDAARTDRWMKRGAFFGVMLNLLVVIVIAITMFSEGRKFLYDSAIGQRRHLGEQNVLLITIDTLRADRLASFGGPPGLTPHLDRFAAEGVSFTAAISQSPWTLPAVASIFTGLTPHRHGAGESTSAFDILARTPLPEGVWNVTETFAHSGYLTQAIVTNPYLSMRYGFGRGFEGYENLTMESEAFIALGNTLVFRLLTFFWPSVVVGDVGATVTRRAERWLRRHRDEKFFLWLHYIDVHAPYGDPRSLGNKSFRGDTVWPGDLWSLLKEAAQPSLGDRFVNVARLRAGEIRLSAEQRKELVALYDAGVRYEDEQIGQVLAELDRLGLREHTVVVIPGDHGEEFWEHGGVEHGHTLYDELVRVPLIMRIPGGPRGTRVSEVVRLIDIAPTVLDITGCDGAPQAIDGRSLHPLLFGEPDADRSALSEALLFADEKRALRTRDFKYIVWENGKEELYDLTTDPGERLDLAAREDLLAAYRAMARQAVSAAALPRPSSVPLLDAGARDLLRALGYVN